MIKAEKILARFVTSKQPKDSLIQIFKDRQQNEDILLAMKEISWETWKQVTDQYETHSLHEQEERIAFEKWFDNEI